MYIREVVEAENTTAVFAFGRFNPPTAGHKKQFNKLLNAYNGKDYQFDSIKVISAGERDPDADGVSGVSASKMRELAARGDRDNFVRMTPLDPKLAGTMYDDVRKGLGVTMEPA
jgi:hypothetical protein